MLLYLIALQYRLDHLLLIALFWDPTKRGYEFMSLSVLKLFSLWPLSESLFGKVIEALFNLTQFFIIRLSSKATAMYFLSKKQFLTSGEKMTQKSNFLGKTNKNNGFTSNWPTRQNFTTTTNKIALCPERVNARLQVDSLRSIPPLVELSNSIRSSFEAKHSSFRASWS